MKNSHVCCEWGEGVIWIPLNVTRRQNQHQGHRLPSHRPRGPAGRVGSCQGPRTQSLTGDETLPYCLEHFATGEHGFDKAFIGFWRGVSIRQFCDPGGSLAPLLHREPKKTLIRTLLIYLTFGNSWYEYRHLGSRHYSKTAIWSPRNPLVRICHQWI